MSVDTVIEKLGPGFREFHIVGGLDRELKMPYHLELLSRMREAYPDTCRQCYTAIEVEYYARISRMTLEEGLDAMKEAGLDAICGGGGEIFHPEVRNKICGTKLTADEYLNVHRKAHERGIGSNCTMLYGHIEKPWHVIDHLIRLRELQDETGGFLAFIPLSYHPDNNEMSYLPKPGGVTDLRAMAISRLIFDNIYHIKTFWIMLGLKLGQAALHFGSDDFDGTVVEERITHDAGADTPQGLTRTYIIDLIRDAGYIPVERDTLYREYWRGDALAEEACVSH